MRKPFVLDPRAFIVGPFKPCPKCGRPEFGTLTVTGNSLTRRCRSCWHSSSEQLPTLSKHVIYLDQFVLSEMAKSLDPVWREKKPDRDPFWLERFDRVERLAKLQLAVFPESPVHQRESVVLPYYGVLRRLYEHLSGEVRFKHPTQVQVAQLGRAWRQYIGLEAKNAEPVRDDALDGKVDEWLDNIAIRVRMGGLEPKPEAVDQERVARAQAMADLHKIWAAQKRSFKDYYRIERTGAADGWWQLYVSYEKTRLRFWTGDPDAMDEMINARLEAIFVADRVSWLMREQAISYPEAAMAVRAFLYDEAALAIPSNEIAALMMASIAFRASSGMLRPPSPGMWNDISVISAYLPYCDAMFLDNECQNILAEGPIRRRLPPKTRIFSRRLADELMSYLLAIETAAGEQHVDLIRAVYGEKQLTPWREVLEHERKKEAKRGEGEGRGRQRE